MFTKAISNIETVHAIRSELNEAFSPGAPVLERDLFAGRLDQLRLLIDAVEQRGRHALIFGERGVGKTSLANVLNLVVRNPLFRTLYAKLNAEPGETFTTLWKKIFRRLSTDARVDRDIAQLFTNICDQHYGELSVDDIVVTLSAIPARASALIVIDEFDRIHSTDVTTAIADTLKALSDYSSRATIVLVGVADDVGQLIEGHRSVARAMVQVKMPRMSQLELAQIIATRYKRCGMRADEEAMWKMTFLARGLPFYAQLIGMHSGRAALDDHRREINAADVGSALSASVSELDQSIQDSYMKAIRSPRNDALFAHVLLACALAKGDELGAFQQSAVTQPLNRILPGKNYKPATFASHMNEFCNEQRGGVLHRDGESRNYRYRFSDPLMQPFVILKGLATGMIDDDTAEVYQNRRQLELSDQW